LTAFPRHRRLGKDCAKAIENGKQVIEKWSKHRKLMLEALPAARFSTENASLS
jgi:hypothetical protein